MSILASESLSLIVLLSPEEDPLSTYRPLEVIELSLHSELIL